MKLNLKKAVKFAGAACVETGVVALSSVVASGAAVTAVKEGFKTAKATMKKLLEEQNEDASITESQEVTIVREPQQEAVAVEAVAETADAELHDDPQEHVN